MSLSKASPNRSSSQSLRARGDYYGIRGFFKWLETRTYKMHVRVYLSRYRSTVTCPDCQGTRFTHDALLYRINTLTIGQVYALQCG